MSQLILIADGDAEAGERLDVHLRREGFRTVGAMDGQAALDLHGRVRPDLILLDAGLPGRDGWDVLGEIRRRGPTPVVMTAEVDDGVSRVQALRIGADDYLARPVDALEAATRVHAILRRLAGASGAGLLKVGALEVDPAGYQAAVVTPEGRRKLALTLTEFRILAQLAQVPSRVFSRAELSEGCRPSRASDTRTLDSHVSHLRRKLAESGATEVVVNVRGVGYRLDPAF